MFIDGFKSHDAVFQQWNVNPDGKTVIFAVYVHEGSDSEWAVAYRAKALVIFHQGNDLFIVEETHFAFDGLKFWNPNKISIMELKKTGYGKWPGKCYAQISRQIA